MKSTRKSNEEITFVLIGSLGSGKSSTGNCILGDKKFKTSVGTVATTDKIERQTAERYGVHITVIDTPGLRRTSDLHKIRDDLKNGQKVGEIGQTVYLIVVQIGRYTKEERELLDSIYKQYKQILRSSIVIFTNRNELADEENPSDRTIDGWLHKNPSLHSLIQGNKLKYLAFENKRSLAEEKDNQVRDLISLVVRDTEYEENVCPVSDCKKQRSDVIIVTRDLMVKSFGQFGEEFFDEQLKYQM